MSLMLLEIILCGSENRAEASLLPPSPSPAGASGQDVRKVPELKTGLFTQKQV